MRRRGLHHGSAERFRSEGLTRGFFGIDREIIQVGAGFHRIAVSIGFPDHKGTSDGAAAAQIDELHVAGAGNIRIAVDRRVVGVCGDRDILCAGDAQRGGYRHAGAAVDDGDIAGAGDHRRTRDHLAGAGCRYRDILRAVDGQSVGDRHAGAAVGERNIAGAGDVHRAGECRIARLDCGGNILYGEDFHARGDGGAFGTQHHVCRTVAGNFQRDYGVPCIGQSAGDGEGVGRRVIADLAVVDAVSQNIGIVDLVDLHAVDGDTVAGGGAELHKAVGRAVFIGGGRGREAVFHPGAPRIAAVTGQVGLRIQGGVILRALVHVMNTDMTAGDIETRHILYRGLSPGGGVDHSGKDAVAVFVRTKADGIQVAARDLHGVESGRLVGIRGFCVYAEAYYIAVLADGKERGMVGNADGSAFIPTVGIDTCAAARAFAAGGLHGSVAGDGEALRIAVRVNAGGPCRRAGRGDDLTAGGGEGTVIGDAGAAAAVGGAGFGNDGAAVDPGVAAGDAFGLRHIARCRPRSCGKLAAADGEFGRIKADAPCGGSAAVIFRVPAGSGDAAAAQPEAAPVGIDADAPCGGGCAGGVDRAAVDDDVGFFGCDADALAAVTRDGAAGRGDNAVVDRDIARRAVQAGACDVAALAGAAGGIDCAAVNGDGSGVDAGADGIRLGHGHAGGGEAALLLAGALGVNGQRSAARNTASGGQAALIRQNQMYVAAQGDGIGDGHFSLRHIPAALPDGGVGGQDGRRGAGLQIALGVQIIHRDLSGVVPAAQHDLIGRALLGAFVKAVQVQPQGDIGGLRKFKGNVRVAVVDRLACCAAGAPVVCPRAVGGKLELIVAAGGDPGIGDLVDAGSDLGHFVFVRSGIPVCAVEPRAVAVAYHADGINIHPGLLHGADAHDTNVVGGGVKDDRHVADGGDIDHHVHALRIAVPVHRSVGAGPNDLDRILARPDAGVGLFVQTGIRIEGHEIVVVGGVPVGTAQLRNARHAVGLAPRRDLVRAVLVGEELAAEVTDPVFAAAVLGLGQAVAGGRDHPAILRDFVFAVFIREIFAADRTSPIRAVAALRAGGCFALGLGQAVAGSGDLHGLCRGLGRAVLIAEQFAADGASPVFAVAVLGAGGCLGFGFRQSVRCAGNAANAVLRF